MGWYEEHAKVLARADEAEKAAAAAIRNEYITRQRLEAFMLMPFWGRLGWLVLGPVRAGRLQEWLRAHWEGVRGLGRRIPWLRKPAATTERVSVKMGRTFESPGFTVEDEG